MKNEKKQNEPSRHDRQENRVGNDPTPEYYESKHEGREQDQVVPGRTASTDRSLTRLKDDAGSSPEEW